MTRPPVVAIVDDDRSVTRALVRLLKSAGFDALPFGSAGAFLGDSRQKDVACLVLDVRMPEMDGLALQARLADSGSRVPIVFITATDDPVSEERAWAGGALAFLRKPFDDTTLLDAVRRAVKMSGHTE